MKHKSVYVTLLAIGLQLALAAQQNKDDIEQLDEVVITATKYALKKELSGKIIYKIDQEQLENKKGMTVLEVIDQLSGVHIQGSGNTAGKNKSMYIRGGRDRQTVVMIDGVSVYDPSGIHATYDLRLLALDQIESIEIMNGAASTLYGSGTATGVINIITKKPSNKGITGSGFVVMGTNTDQSSKKASVDIFSQQVSLSGTSGKWSYRAGLFNENSGGMSEAKPIDQSVFQEDNWKTTNSILKMRYKVHDNFSVQVFSNFDKHKYDFDAGPYTDSDSNKGQTEQFRLGVTSKLKINKGEVSILAVQNRVTRSFGSFNPWSNSLDHYNYEGKSFIIETLGKITFDSAANLITGLNYQRIQNDTQTPFATIDKELANYTTLDPFAHLTINLQSGFNLNIGTRLNTHSEYGNHWVYNVNPSFNFNKNWRVLTGFSTAFIAPSTYQLFSQYGNLDLKPENDQSFELGFEYGKNQSIEFTSVYFNRLEKNAIQLRDFVQYKNLEGSIRVKGIESQMQLKLMDMEKLQVGYIYVDKEDDRDYIPKHKITMGLNSSRIKNTFLAFNFKHISERTYWDQWGSGEIIKLEPYSVFDIYVSHTFKAKGFSMFVNFTNVLNKDYEEIIGYSTKGRNLKIGLVYNF